MVVFTCNHCGGSVKKPAVVKHYGTKCRGKAINLTCMDCQKDFGSKEHDGHTKCVSEAERYSGKDYVPKPGQNKGQRKQDSWIDTIRSLSTSKDKIDHNLQSVFKRLCSYENIPRKKAKFQNFVSNSFKIQKPVAMKVWDILEQELGKLKKVNISKKNGENEQKENENTNSIESEKKSLESADDDDDDNIAETQLNGTDISKANKKKSKRKNLENESETQEEENIKSIKKKKKKDKVVESVNATQKDEIQQLSNENKNKNKKSKKNKKLTEEINEDEVIGNGDINKQNKKKQKKDQIDELSNNKENHGEQVQENGFGDRKSKKNKRTIENTFANGLTNGNDEPTKKKEKITNETVDEKNKKFDWFSFINKCAADGIDVDKLKQKVLKKYKKQNPNAEITNKVEKTFRKYLKKSGLVIENNIVKIES